MINFSKAYGPGIRRRELSSLFFVNIFFIIIYYYSEIDVSLLIYFLNYFRERKCFYQIFNTDNGRSDFVSCRKWKNVQKNKNIK